MKTSPRIPKQFKAYRAISDGPFAYWVDGIVSSSNLTMADLKPTEKDLELISRLAYQRDEVGDRLAALILKDHRVAKQLDQGLDKGIASLDNPAPELVKFLEHYENIPDWAYLPDLKKFVLCSRSENVSIAKKIAPPFFLDGFAMAAGFFIGANYPGVGHSIVSTGSVARGSIRMNQTMQYVDDMMNVKDFQPFGKAVRSNAKVRLAHAFARTQIVRAGKWDVDYYGEIISEFDNLIFLSGLTYLYTFAGKFGIRKRGKQALKIQLKAMQYLLGAPKELVTMSLEDNMRLFVMVVAHLDDSPHTARQVVRAFQNNTYFRPTDTLGGKVKRELSFLTANLFSRTFWGNGMADEIGLNKTYYGLPLNTIADALSEPPTIAAKLSPYIINAGVQMIGFAQSIARLRKKTKMESDTTPYRGSFNVIAK